MSRKSKKSRVRRSERGKERVREVAIEVEREREKIFTMLVELRNNSVSAFQYLSPYDYLQVVSREVLISPQD